MAIAFGASLGTPVQDTENSLTTIALTTNVTVPSGSFIVLGITFYNSGTTLSGVADNGPGLTYSNVRQRNGTVDTNHRVTMETAQAPSGMASGTVITATFSAGSFGRAIFGAYFTGIATSSPNDVFADNGSATAASPVSWNTGSATTTNADDLAVSVYWGDGQTGGTNAPASTTPTTNEILDFNNAGGGNNAAWNMQYRILTATGSFNLAGTETVTTFQGGSEYNAVMGTFKADTGGGGGGSYVLRRFPLGV